MAQQNRRDESDDEEDERDERRGNRSDMRSNYYKVLVGVGNAQWWATLGASILAVGLILIALAYATLKVIPTVPQDYLGIFPLIGFEAYSVGIVVAAFGFILMLYARYKLAKTSWIK